jgi:hypothetical protein
MNDGKMTDMAIYFHRPIQFSHLTYIEFNKIYICDTSLRSHAQNNGQYATMNIPGINKTIYITTRCNPIANLIRMEMLYPSAGEIWYLRLILQNRPCQSYEDARTYHGILYSTFQLSAIAHKYVDSEKETTLCFEEALMFSTARELRYLFSSLTLQGFPTLHLFETERFYLAMTEDYHYEANIIQSIDGIKNALLCDLQSLFIENNKSLSDYSLPEPNEYPTEIEREKMKYNENEQSNLFHLLNRQIPNTDEQESIFQLIKTCIDEDKSGKYFIQGQGGCGKTMLAKKILSYTRSQGKIALGCASTGLAATIYDDFYTAHDLFCFPVVEEGEEDESEPPYCQFETKKGRKALLDEAKVIIWDEMVSNCRDIYEAAYEAMNGFRGKILIGMGDWRQTLPIVPHGRYEEIRNACMKSSHLWNQFDILMLTRNMRLQSLSPSNAEIQQQYAQMILTIGEGRPNHINIDYLMDEENKQKQLYGLLSIPYYISTNDLLSNDNLGIILAKEWLYPDGFENVLTSTILAATNQRVDEWNEIVQLLNPSPLYTIFSNDTLSEVDDPHGYLKGMLTTSVLNTMNHNSVPPHKLNLKVNDICLITRNLSKRYGLANNTRVRILEISPQQTAIRIQTIGNSPKSATIPRIRFKFRLPFSSSFQMTRIQFPLRLAYCMTYNKSQGQTLDKVLLDITSPPFAHGHLYVALSRVTNSKNIRIICLENQIYQNVPIVWNTVYPDLL